MNRTQCFDGLIRFSPPADTAPVQAKMILRNVRIPVDLQYYPREGQGGRETAFVHISLSQPVEVGWGDPFTLEAPAAGSYRITGTVLDPTAQKLPRNREKKRLEFLQALTGDAKEMFYALARKKGIAGVSEKDLSAFASLSDKDRIEIAQTLEGEGRIKILTFSPLLVVAQSSVEFLCEKILEYVYSRHRDKPEIMGISEEQIQERFQLETKILALAVKYLEKEEKLLRRQGRIFPADFQLVASPEEEDLLAELEALILKGEFHRIPQDELRRRFRLSELRMERLLALLAERQKIVQSSDGFLLHSRWLDELIVRIKRSGKEELSVADFKELTGLSRKYAIPLLEFLDQMGVTLRRGNVRKILRD